MSFLRYAVPAGLAALFTGAAPAGAQIYPAGPIRIITGDPGGAVDFTSRIISQGIAAPLGQPVLVENRGGAGGAIAIGSVARATPDGQTLLVYSSAVWIVPLLKDKAGWDAFRNFQPITIAARAPQVVVVHPSMPVNSIRQLIAFARAHPGALNYPSSGVGSGPHLATELFKSMARVDIVHVPYKGAAPGLNDTISGQMQLNFSVAGLAVPHIKAGRLRALAVTGIQRSALVPDLPTISESGLPGYDSTQLFGIYAPFGTPAAIVSRLNQEMARVLNAPEAKSRLLGTGLEVVASSPEETAAIIKADMARMGKVIRDAGIREE